MLWSLSAMLGILYKLNLIFFKNIFLDANLNSTWLTISVKIIDRSISCLHGAVTQIHFSCMTHLVNF